MSNLIVLTVSGVHALHALENVRGGWFELLRQNFVNILTMPNTPDKYFDCKGLHVDIRNITSV